QLPLAQEPLPAADLSPDRAQPAAHPAAGARARPGGARLGAARRALVARRLWLAGAPPPRAARPPPRHPGAPHPAGGRAGRLVRPSRGAAVTPETLGHPAVALIGSRGIPARYGGYETLMEELSVRLLARGFRVTVYCRSHSTPPRLTHYRGVELVVL